MRAVWTQRLDEGFAEHLAAHEQRWASTLGDISPVPFACAVWRLACPPDADPGFVRWHPRVLSAELAPSTWDGTLGARVALVAPWPAALDRPRDWSRDHGWRDWPTVLGQYVEPADRDTATVPHLRSTLLAETPVPFTGLPPAPERPAAVPESARRVLAVLARELDALLGPLLARLDTPAPRTPDRRE